MALLKVGDVIEGRYDHSSTREAFFRYEIVDIADMRYQYKHNGYDSIIEIDKGITAGRIKVINRGDNHSLDAHEYTKAQKLYVNTTQKALSDYSEAELKEELDRRENANIHCRGGNTVDVMSDINRSIVDVGVYSLTRQSAIKLRNRLTELIEEME